MTECKCLEKLAKCLFEDSEMAAAVRHAHNGYKPVTWESLNSHQKKRWFLHAAVQEYS